MATTLKDIRDQVDRKLGNYTENASSKDVGDGTSLLFRLPYRNIVTGSVAVTVDGVTGSGILDPLAGWFTFSTPPASGAVVLFQFQYKHWSDQQTNDAINSGIGELFGKFYTSGQSTFTTTGEQEYAALDSLGAALTEQDRITRVEYQSTSGSWIKLDTWSVFHISTYKWLHFEGAPASNYTIRISYKAMPTELIGDVTTLVSTGLPERAKEPLILYAASELLAARIANRIRDDRANNTQNENVVKSYEIVNDAQYFRSLAETKAEKIRMPRFQGRAIL